LNINTSDIAHRTAARGATLVRKAIATLLTASVFAAAATAAPAPPPAPPAPPAPAAAPGTFPDASGIWTNLDAGSAPGKSNAFSQALGANGRSCASCHVESDAWTSTPPNLHKRFGNTAGEDPIFASVDGTNCPSLPIATPAEHQTASSLLLSKGLIRISLAPPARAQFAVSDVVNPYGCTSTSVVSVYRRIPTTANLTLLSTVMWDGRESLAGSSIPADLIHQAGDAVTTHEGTSSVPSASVSQAMEIFESAQFAAQTNDTAAGALNAAGAFGGTLNLSRQPFSPGTNDPFGAAASNPGIPPARVFTLYTAWAALKGTDSVSKARASIARGEQIFNTRPMVITGVAGLNDQTEANGLPRTTVTGTCGTCHDAPNAGSHSFASLFNTGVADGARRSADLPLVTLINRTTGATVQSTDPGLALTSGVWADIGKFKVPTLRLLAARAPYFHNGSAPTLGAVVAFYDQRFDLKLSAQEQADLVAFMGAL
jgi:cytochrome c peroxidase